MLLVGPPGTGKTLLARAVAGEAGVPFFILSGSEFVEMFVGVGAARVRDLFEQAKREGALHHLHRRAGRPRQDRPAAPASCGGHDEREQTLNQLLVEMDGFDSTKRRDHDGGHEPARDARPGAAAPRAVRPPGASSIGPTSAAARRSSRSTSQNVKLAPDVNLSVIAALTPGFVGADLANLVNEAALLAARKGKDAVDMADFDEAIERVIAGLEREAA